MKEKYTFEYLAAYLDQGLNADEQAELEKDLHGLFKEVRLPQTEYFRLSEAQVSKIHKLMTSLAEF